MISNNRLRALFLLVLAIGTAFQLWVFVQGYQGDSLRVWKSAGQHALWRSANFAINQDAADYIAFVHVHVPEDGRVVLPATETKASPLLRTPLMQFFLFPREVLNCSRGDDACLPGFSNSDAYILVFKPGLFPGEQVEDASRLLLQTERLGIYLPVGASPQAGKALPLFESFGSMALQAIAPAFFLLLLTALGTLALRWLAGSMSLLARSALGNGLALGLFSVLVYILSLLGLSFKIATLLGLVFTGLLCLVSYVLTRRLNELEVNSKEESSSLLASIDIWHILFFALSGLLMLTAVGKGFFFGDEMVLWGPKSYGIAHAGLSSGVSNWGTSTINYPLHVFILIGTFKQWFGELLPASKMLFPLYFLSLLLLSYEFLRQRIPRYIAGLAVLAMASTPVIITHAEISYANLPNSYYFVAATIIGMYTLAKPHSLAKNMALSLLASLFFTFGMWTRPEGVALSALGILFVLLIGWQQWDTAHRKKLTASLLAPFVVFVLLWTSTSQLIYPENLRAGATFSEMLNQLSKGDLHLYELGVTISFFFTDAFYSFKDWGILGFGITLLLIGALISKRKELKTNMLVGNGLLSGIAVIGLLYFTSYNVSGSCDLSCYLTGGMHRFIMPAMAALWLGLCVIVFKTEPVSKDPA